MTDEIRDYADGDQDFANWLTLVDGALRARLGVGLFDLEDFPLRDAFDLGEDPVEVAYEIALAHEWEETDQ